jgi:hypothetical protein
VVIAGYPCATFFEKVAQGFVAIEDEKAFNINHARLR